MIPGMTGGLTEGRKFIDAALQAAQFGQPHTKRDLGRRAYLHVTQQVPAQPTLMVEVFEAAERGYVDLANEMLRRVRLKIGQHPGIAAFYAYQSRDATTGKRQSIQAPLLTMPLKLGKRVVRRLRQQGDRSHEIADLISFAIQVGEPVGAQTIGQALAAANLNVQLYVEQGP